MAKKSFKGGFDSLLGESSSENNKKSPKNNSPKDEIRATFIVDREKYEKLKVISFWERSKLKESLDKALNNYITDYEEKKGEITLPKSKE